MFKDEKMDSQNINKLLIQDQNAKSLFSNRDSENKISHLAKMLTLKIIYLFERTFLPIQPADTQAAF